MSANFEVSFNSPQCGWMSIGFESEMNKFHTTTAYSPHSEALSELLNTLVSLLKTDRGEFSHLMKWNRDPEEFDFVFRSRDNIASIEIIEYPTGSRERKSSDTVFFYEGEKRQFIEAFYKTFLQLYEERDVDEFEENWHQKFPTDALRSLAQSLGGQSV